MIRLPNTRWCLNRELATGRLKLGEKMDNPRKIGELAIFTEDLAGQGVTQYAQEVLCGDWWQTSIDSVKSPYRGNGSKRRWLGFGCAGAALGLGGDGGGDSASRGEGRFEGDPTG